MSESIGTIIAVEHRPDGTVAIRLVLPRLPDYPINIGDKYKLYPATTPPRDAYDLAEMITAKVLYDEWDVNAVADAIQKYIESLP